MPVVGIVASKIQERYYQIEVLEADNYKLNIPRRIRRRDVLERTMCYFFLKDSPKILEHCSILVKYCSKINAFNRPIILTLVGQNFTKKYGDNFTNLVHRLEYMVYKCGLLIGTRRDVYGGKIASKQYRGEKGTASKSCFSTLAQSPIIKLKGD